MLRREEPASLRLLYRKNGPYTLQRSAKAEPCSRILQKKRMLHLRSSRM